MVTDLYPQITRYLLRVTPARQGVLKRLETEARRADFPIIGPLAGRLLYQLALLTRARRVFELGSGFGYSALWFAMALGKSGEIQLTDRDPKNRERALANFRSARIATRVKYHIGDALEPLARSRGAFDIILNDIDKDRYPLVVDLALRKLRVGGLLITDNLLWDGKVFRAGGDKTTRGVKEYTRLVYANPRFFTTIIPIRDGVAVSMKLK